MANPVYDDGDLGPDDELWTELHDEVADILEAVLVEHGPTPAVELADLLRTVAPGLVRDLVEDDEDDEDDGDEDEGEATLEAAVLLVEAVTTAYDGFWNLPDGRLAAIVLAQRPARFSHRLSADEFARGALDGYPDLAGLVDRFEFPLRSGGICHDRAAPFPGASEMGSFIGPAGWLDGFAPGDLVVIDWDASTIAVESGAPGAIDPADDERVIEALRAALSAHGSDSILEPFELMVDVRVVHPELFVRTVSPLGELLARAGIEVRDAWLGWADQRWETPPEQLRRKRFDSLMRSPDLERCCRNELRTAFDAWRGWDGEPLAASAADRVADALDHGPVPDLLWEMLAPRAVAELGSWVDAVAEGAADTSAGLLYVRGRIADGRCEPRTAIEHLERAHVLDPGHPAVVVALAELRADEGDGPRAASLLGRLGVARDDLLFHTLAPGVVALAGVGRNDRCPCGSGRKFKACCARSPQPPELTVRLRWLLSRAARYTAQRHSDLVEETVNRLESAYRGGGDPGTTSAAALELILFDHGHLAGYLRARGELLAEDERETVSTWLGEGPRLLEVVATNPGESFEALDLRSGERLVIADAAGSENLVVGDAVLARALPAGRRWLLPGGVHRVPLHARAWLLDELDEPFTASKLFAVIERLTALPLLRNREGDSLVLQRATFAVGDAAAARAALVELVDIEALADPDDELGELVLEYALNADELIMRGRFEFSDGQVVIDTNSAERLDLMHSLLVAAAPDAVLIDVETTGADELWRGIRDRRDGADLEPAADDVEPELAAIAQEFIQTMERRWVDEQIPALGGFTPRQSLVDPTRRGDLVRLLDEMSQDAGGNGFNADRLRALLGL